MTQPDKGAADLLTRTAVHSWKLSLARLDRMFASVGDDGLQMEIAPGKNRIFYLLGHMAAVHDRMLPLLRLGERLRPDLDEDFLTSPDRTRPDRFTAAELRRAWTDINTTLTRAIEGLEAEAWLDRHDDIPAEDFAREPLRNRLAVLLSRTAHVHFHAGQIRLAVKEG